MESKRKHRGNRRRGREDTNKEMFSEATPREQDKDINCEADNLLPSNMNAARKFEEACAQMQQSIQHFVGQDDSNYASSSEEEYENQDDILNTLLTSYTSGDANNHTTPDLGRTHEYLKNAFKTGASVCLVCIATIRKTESVWSCEFCYDIFHLPCIQKWAKDSVFAQEQAMQDDESTRRSAITWFCPKCRYEYSQSKKPTKYLCFCGKEVNPRDDPWLVPHTCGQRCGKSLKPDCGHFCLMLCHPGPCPPCPKTINVSCYCGSAAPQSKRCSAREWSCRQKCNRLLGCKQHRCVQACHPGECAACPRQSLQSCQCGTETAQRPCSSTVWQCNKVCGRKLECGQHLCEVICHSGPCGQCPRTGERSCPCGKNRVVLPCTEEIPPCGDTCGKWLECGVHACSQRCHVGSCGTCLQMQMKHCRCGYRHKDFPCHKDFRCETKCKKIRDCNRHQCNRKCCDGLTCPPCEQQCSRTLGCRNHKCSSRCHQGPCYPCPLTVELKCNCGNTTLRVPCGREKVTKPPKCTELCSLPPDCHHKTRLPHRCHFGRCPPCQQICSKLLRNCDHTCPAKCHTAVLVKTVGEKKRQGPWEPAPAPKLEVLDKKCPRCKVPVPVTCFGLHETSDFACSEARPYSCGKQCGRQLVCGNHSCSLECHIVTGSVNDTAAGDSCEVCEKSCSKVRAPGCTHKCLQSCHPQTCAPCKQMVKLRCHCQLNMLYVECAKWTSSDKQTKTQLLSCNNQCPQHLTCGHRCPLNCHQSDCPSSDTCRKKVSLRCACKRLKKDIICNIRATVRTECNEECQRVKKLQLKEKEKEEERLMEEENKKTQKELETFLNKTEGRKRKRKKTAEEIAEETYFHSHYKIITASVGLVVLAVFAYLVLR